jgi:hypothetical protein
MTAIYDFSVVLMFFLGAIVFLLFFFITAPYGKFLQIFFRGELHRTNGIKIIFRLILLTEKQ